MIPKLLNKPNAGQCSFQLPYSQEEKLDDFYLFNVVEDYHELHDQKAAQPEIYAKMQKQVRMALLVFVLTVHADC